MAPRTRWLPVVLIVTTVGLTYWPAQGGDFIWDDVPLIVHNPALRSFDDLAHKLFSPFWSTALDESREGKPARSYFRPLVTFSLILDYQLYGPNPRGFHLTNLLLHLAATLLVYVLARRMIRQDWPAWVAACAFALHPSRTESVVWISGRSDVLAAVFFLLALLLLIHALQRERPHLPLTLAAISFGAALLSKESSIVLPVIVLLWDLLDRDAREPRRLRRNLVSCHLPLVALATCFAAWRLWQGSTTIDATLAERLAQVVQAAGHYGMMLLNPYQPNPQIAPFYLARGPDGPTLAVGAVLILTLALCITYGVRRRLAWAWPLLVFAVLLLPVLNLVPLGLRCLVAERFLYLPFIGIALLVAFFLRAEEGRHKRIAFSLTLLLLASWGLASHLRCYDYQSSLRFWLAADATGRDNPLVQQMIAQALAERGERKAAEPWLERAHRNWVRLGQARDAWDAKLAWIDLRLSGAPDEQQDRLRTIQHELSALLPAPNQAERAIVLALLGSIASRLERDPLAVEYFAQSIALEPGRSLTHYKMAQAYGRALDLARARKAIARARELDPSAVRYRALELKLNGLEPQFASAALVHENSGGAASVRLSRARAEIYNALGAGRLYRLELERALRLEPKSLPEHLALIRYWASLGELKSAQEAFARSVAVLGPRQELRKLKAQLDTVSNSH
jgi:tetratricopeptide (TPR) repeat protein